MTSNALSKREIERMNYVVRKLGVPTVAKIFDVPQRAILSVAFVGISPGPKTIEKIRRGAFCFARGGDA